MTYKIIYELRLNGKPYRLSTNEEDIIYLYEQKKAEYPSLF